MENTKRPFVGIKLVCYAEPEHAAIAPGGANKVQH